MLTNRSHSPLYLPLLIAICGILFSVWNALDAASVPCVSAGCTLYQNFSINGYSLWWGGVGIFSLLGLLALTGRAVLGRWLAGLAVLLDCVLLGIMILPTIISVSESSLRAVPESYYEGSLALGATHERSVFSAVFPAARSGILAGIILGVGRAIGETMAVVMIAGNQPILPKSLLSGVRTLTANIVLEMGYATDLHREALIACGVVLFVFILLINLCFSAVKRKADAT